LCEILIKLCNSVEIQATICIKTHAFNTQPVELSKSEGWGFYPSSKHGYTEAYAKFVLRLHVNWQIVWSIILHTQVCKWQMIFVINNTNPVKWWWKLQRTNNNISSINWLIDLSFMQSTVDNVIKRKKSLVMFPKKICRLKYLFFDQSMCTHLIGPFKFFVMQMINISYITVKPCWQKQSMACYSNHYWKYWRILYSSSLIYYVTHTAPF